MSHLRKHNKRLLSRSVERLESLAANLVRYLVAVILCASLTNLAYAQSASDSKIATVMSVINFLLLEEQGPRTVELVLDELQRPATSINTNSPLTATFPRTSGDVEFCFVLTSSQANSVSLSINGIDQEGSNRPIVGENCYTIPVGQQVDLNEITFSTDISVATISFIGLERSNPSELSLSTLSRRDWGEEEVRKVLKIFAFGGHARDSQINEWANMPSSVAITEMLNFDEHNSKLSPLAVGEQYRDVASQHGTLIGFANFLSSESSNLPIPAQIVNPDNGDIYYPREQYAIDSYNFDGAFIRMATTRGLNPFRQRIGFWETNYHLAVNLDAGVQSRQLAHYYDEIMQAHEAGLPYEQVMGVAAKSAAIAMQYGHRRNEWVFDNTLNEFVCQCNFDFAREIHQLFYGIFGVDDPNHEDGTINETGKMLTDMRVPYINNFGFDTKVTFETDDHHTGSLTILGETISGANASQKIDNLMPISIEHPESLRNLPIMIISTLADDNLNETRSNQLRAAWAAMEGNKNLLRFLRVYATSTLFHSPNQFKYFTSHERAMYQANVSNLDNVESYLSGRYFNNGLAGRPIEGVINDDAAGEVFHPLHNVFGGQNSLEAADSALAFEKNYNRQTEGDYAVRNSVQCAQCNNGQAWEKKWATVLPRRADGQYYVSDVAEWLWKRATGSLDRYSELERAHMYFLLGAVRRSPGEENDQNRVFDLPLMMCIIEDYQRSDANADISLSNLMSNQWFRYCGSFNGDYTALDIEALNRSYTGQQIADNAIIQGLLTELGNQTLPLTSSGQSNSDNLRRYALGRVNTTLGFVFTTPFVFAEGQ